MGHVWLAHERHGATVEFVAASENQEISLEEYRAAIDERTCLVSVSHVSYYNGFLQDVAAVTKMGRRHGALVFVDAYQSAGAVPIDVQRDDIDILASGSQKFLLGCPGMLAPIKN